MPWEIIIGLVAAAIFGIVVGFLFGFLFAKDRFIATRQKENTAKELEFATLRERLNAAEQKAAELSDQIDTLETEAENARKATSAAEAREAALSERIAARDAEIQKLRADLTAEKATIEETRKSLFKLQAERAEISARIEEQKIQQQQTIEHLQRNEQALREAFQALAAESLKQNSEGFIKQAETRLEPVKTLLEKLEKNLQQTVVERSREQGQLREHLETLQRAQTELQKETRNLVTALRRPEVRGNWGELQLRRVVELAGMVEYCDFTTQVAVTTRGDSDTRLKPDLIAHLPGGQNIVVDAKCPLDAYLAALEAPNTEIRTQELQRHARQLRDKIRSLSAKSYYEQFEHSPEFVVLFLPGEAFLQAAIEQDPALIEDAVRDRVIIATPTTLIALLKAVAYGWRQQAAEENAQQIRQLAIEISSGICTFLEHYEKTGRELDAAVKAYNSSVGSLERSVISRARRMEELGAPPPANKQLTEPAIIETVTRQTSARQN